MTPSRHIKPISYLKANAARIVLELAEEREPIIITQNGEAKAVIQDIESFEQAQETMALLKILALGNRQIEQGRVTPLAEVMEQLRTSQYTLGVNEHSSACEAHEPTPSRRLTRGTKSRPRPGRKAR